MMKLATRYGLWSMLLLVGLSWGSFLFLGDKNYEIGEIVGYSTMVLALAFVFFGIKKYRNDYNGGYLSFGQGMKVGLLITLIPAIGFGIFDLLYVKVLNPNWTAEYSAHLKATMNAAEQAEFDKQMAMFANPVVQFLLMTSTVLIIGIIITIISSLALMRKRRAGMQPGFTA